MLYSMYSSWPFTIWVAMEAYIWNHELLFAFCFSDMDYHEFGKDKKICLF